MPAALAPVALEPHTVDPVVHRRRWAILTVLCTSLMIVIIGNTALNVAIPRLAEDLHASTSRLQWMVDAYGLVFAGMLFTAGAIGDRFGRKGTLQAGLALFLVGTTIAAWSPARRFVALRQPQCSAVGWTAFALVLPAAALLDDGRHLAALAVLCPLTALTWWRQTDGSGDDGGGGGDDEPYPLPPGPEVDWDRFMRDLDEYTTSRPV